MSDFPSAGSPDGSRSRFAGTPGRPVTASMRKLGWYEGSIVSAVELWLRAIAAVDADDR